MLKLFRANTVFHLLNYLFLFVFITNKTWSQVTDQLLWPKAKVLLEKEQNSSGGKIISRILKVDKDYVWVDYKEGSAQNSAFPLKLSGARVANQLIVSLQANETEATLRNLVVGGLNGKVVRKIYGINAYVVELSEVSFEAIPRAKTFFQNYSNVIIKVEENSLRVPNKKPNDPQFLKQWGLHWQGYPNADSVGDWTWNNWSDADIDAPEAWEITSGSASVIVGIIDTGVDNAHPDLSANMWKNPKEIPNNKKDDDNNGLIDDVNGYNFWENNANVKGDDHGTHVAGIVAATGNNGIGIAGVSWSSKIMALKCGNNAGIVVDATISAIYYAIDQKVNVLNCSFGGNEFQPLEKAAIDAAQAAGILIVCSAGNDGENDDLVPSYPAGYANDNIISVTATDYKDSFSPDDHDYGIKTVDLAAPGVAILSTVPDGKYEEKSGTSMASPFVAGVAALIKSKRPDWNYSKIKKEILENVDKKPALANRCLSGGRLNASKALKRTASTALYFPETNYIADENVVWQSVKVRRNGAMGVVSVKYVVTSGTAQAGSDFTLNSGTLNFQDGQQETSITFIVTKDAVIEGEENFTIKLTEAQGASIGQPNLMQIKIVDNAPGTLEFVLPEFSAYETIGQATISVIRKGGSFGAASVEFKDVKPPVINGNTALAGSDYQSPIGTLSWKAGETGVKTFPISIVNDATAEYSEFLNLQLSNPKGASLAVGKSSAQFWIKDNEPTRYFFYKHPYSEINLYTATEGSEGFKFEVARKGMLKNETITIQPLDGTATDADDDYNSTPIIIKWTATLNPGAVYQSTQEIEPDEKAEPDEYFFLKIIPSSQSSLGATAQVIIQNGEAAGVLNFQQAAFEITEGDAESFVISRENGTDGHITVDYKIEGTAVLGEDYEIVEDLPLTGTIKFLSGEKIKGFSVSLLEDGKLEGNETIIVTLSNPKNGAVLGQTSKSTLTIKGGDAVLVFKTGQIQFSKDNFSVLESAGFASITMTRINGTFGPAKVTFSTSDEFEATANVDYTTVVGELNWLSGEGGSKNIMIPITNDILKEGDEQFGVYINSVTGATSGLPDATTVTIIDDDLN